MDPGAFSLLLDLPTDVWCLILPNLDTIDVGFLTFTCTYLASDVVSLWRKVSCFELFWRASSQPRWPISLIAQMKDLNELTMRHHYEQNLLPFQGVNLGLLPTCMLKLDLLLGSRSGRLSKDYNFFDKSSQYYLKLKKAFPKLRELRISGLSIASIPRAFKSLPKSLRILSLHYFLDEPLTLTEVGLLPPNLRYFEVNHTIKIVASLTAQFLPKSLRTLIFPSKGLPIGYCMAFLPPKLETLVGGYMNYGFDSPITVGTETRRANDTFWLPRTLTRLELWWLPPFWALSDLPPKLKTFILGDHISSTASILSKLPGTLELVVLGEKLRLDDDQIGFLPNLKVIQPYNTLTAACIPQLPRGLTKLHAFTKNKLFDRHVASLPQTLTDLELGELTSDTQLNALPPGLTSLSILETKSWKASGGTKYPKLLTSLEIPGCSLADPTSFESLPRTLFTLAITAGCKANAKLKYNLPPKLTKLDIQVACSLVVDQWIISLCDLPLKELLLPEDTLYPGLATTNHLTKLPQTLTILKTSTLDYLTAESIASLPPGLMILNLYSLKPTTLIPEDLARLPRNLQSLRIPKSPKLDETSLKYLPEPLDKFWVGHSTPGYFFVQVQRPGARFR